MFDTTLGLRYTAGFGEAASITFDFSRLGSENFEVLASERRHVLFQEVALHVGSGIYFWAQIPPPPSNDWRRDCP